MERKARKLRWKEFIDMPGLDDHGENKATELKRLITMWRTSEKRTNMYKEMEQMEVSDVGGGCSFAETFFNYLYDILNCFS